jgi:hypothetical protein
VRATTVAVCVVGLFLLGSSATVDPVQAEVPHCSLRHRVPMPARRQILRRFVQLRHAPAGPVARRTALIRCGGTVTVILPIEPPPGRRRHCGDPGRQNLCLPYQDDSVWRRRGDGPWRLRGGFLACEEFPAAAGERLFEAGLCAKLEGSARPTFELGPGALRALVSRSAPRLSPQGLGPIHLGMDLGQAEDALGAAIESEDGVNGCSFWTAAGVPAGVELIAFDGRLGYVGVFQRIFATTRGVRVGDGVIRLRHRYRGRLHAGRSASLAGPGQRLFVSEWIGGAIYELEFDLSKGRVVSMEASTRHTIETFGECA